MEYLIGVDLGTSGTKTVLFDTYGNTIASKTIEYPLYQIQNGWAEQDPLDWWNATCNGIKSVITQTGVKSENIKALGISGQMHGLVMLDKNGKILRKSIIWCDQRTAKECEEITQTVGKEKLIEITANPALTGFTAGKILWVRNNEPHIYEQCAHILLPKDYVRYMLTGEFATEVSDASGMQLLDVPQRKWSDEILSLLKIDKALLPHVYESPEQTGTITQKAAELTMLKEGTIVAGGAGDNAAAAVGTGTVTDGKAFTTIGTSGVVFAHTSKIKIDPKGRVHTFCCAVPGEWHVMGVTQAAGLSLKWFRDNFCTQEILQAKEKDIDPYIIMNEEAQKVPVGCNKLIYLPYLMGERTPHLDPDSRGVFFGLSALHTRAHLIRAVMEGVSFSQKDSLNVINQMNINIKEMALCGGGAKSPLWKQMLCDIFNCTVQTVSSSEGPALGAAILAGTSCGIYKTVQEGCSTVIKIKETLNSNKQNHMEYEKYYNIYKELYPSLKNIYKNLSSL